MDKGKKLKDDPKCPVFLAVEVKRASDLWDETNKLALDRLDRLRGEMKTYLNGHNFSAFRQSFSLGEI